MRQYLLIASVAALIVGGMLMPTEMTAQGGDGPSVTADIAVSVTPEYTPPPVYPPVVATGNATGIDCTAATFWGDITDDGNATIILRGFVYGETCEADPGNATAPVDSTWGSYSLEAGSFGNGTYSLQVDDLAGSTLYFYAAVVYNGTYWAYGTCGNFTTPECCNPPTDLQATTVNDYAVALTWTPAPGGNGTIIRGTYGDTPPADPNDGFAVYAGHGATTTHYINMEFLDTDIQFAAFTMCGTVELCCEDCGTADTYSGSSIPATITGGDAMDAIGISLGTLSDMAIIALLFGLPLLLLLYGHRRPNLTIRVPALITAFLAAPLLMPYGLAYAVPIWLLAFGAILRWLIYDIWWSRNWDV